MTLNAEITNPVHYLLGQDPATSTTNYVTASEIAVFADMAARQLAKYAQAYPVIGYIPLVTKVNFYTIPAAPGAGTPYYLLTDAFTAAVACEVGTVRNVVYVPAAMADTSTFASWKQLESSTVASHSLKQIDLTTVGQSYYGAYTTDSPIFYALHGSTNISIYPPKEFSTGSYSLLVYYDGIPTATSGEQLSEDWYDAIIMFCVAKGKEKYQQFEQAKYYMDQFMAVLNIDSKAANESGGPKSA